MQEKNSKVILRIGILIALLAEILIFTRIYQLQEDMHSLHLWSVVKRIRANEFEARLKRLENEYK